MIKYYSYTEIDEDGSSLFFTISEGAILQDYWPYWEMNMISKYGPNHELITEENCIKDWVRVNRAKVSE